MAIMNFFLFVPAVKVVHIIAIYFVHLFHCDLFTCKSMIRIHKMTSSQFPFKRAQLIQHCTGIAEVDISLNPFQA